MKIHEYQGKEILRKFGVPTPEGRLADCGNAQECVEVCPKDIPLTTSIAALEWEATKRMFKKLLGS